MGARRRGIGLETHWSRTKPSFYIWENVGPEKVSDGAGVTRSRKCSQKQSPVLLTHSSGVLPPPRCHLPGGGGGGWKMAGVLVPWRDQSVGVFWDPRASGLEESRRHVGHEAVRSPVETGHPCLALCGTHRFHLPSLWNRNHMGREWVEIKK